jgi:elongation factor P--(R)-beta-lysine ligase
MINFKNLKTRAAIIRAIREFFYENRYLEVDTPIRCPSIIPEAHIEPVRSEGWFLQASPELCMKRLLSRGAEKIFQICKCFRKDERGQLHIPELTMLEWYAKDNNYLDLMDQCESLLSFIADRLNIGNSLLYQGQAINLDSSCWQKLTVEEAFRKYSDISMAKALQNNQFEEIMSFSIEPHLIQAGFLYDYPSSLASLAKLVPTNPKIAQRMEFYIAGIELANGFTELTNAQEQRQRFHRANRIREECNRIPLPIPEKFMEDLQSMPETAGIALGVDRLVMLFCNAASIDEVLTFTPESL